MNQRRICIINPFGVQLFYPDIICRHGGAEVQLAFLARELARHEGVRVVVLLGDQGQPKTDLRDGIEFISFPHRGGMAPRFALQRALWMANADYYLQQAMGSITKEVAFFRKWSRHRFIYWMASEMDVSDEIALRNGYKLRTRWFVWGMHQADLIIAQHAEQARLLLQNEGLPSTIIPNCFPRRPYPTDSRRHHLWIGHCIPLKNPLAMLQIARALKEESFTMVMPREGADAALLAQVERSARDIPNLNLLPRVPFNSMDELFCGAKSLIMTSTTEGFPNTMLQAWWSGAPVGTLHIDPGYMIEQDRLGFSAHGDIDALIQWIGSISASEATWQEYSRRVYSHAEQNLSVERLADQFLEAIGKL